MLNLKIDFHVHTIYSGDSIIKPNEIIKYAKYRGMDGIAITDHNTLKAYDILKKEAESKDFIIIPGMEIETHIGEVIGLFIDDIVYTRDNNFFSIVQRIKDLNGLIVIPHPFDFLRGNHLRMKLLNDDIINDYIDGIEIINSRIIFKKCIRKAEEFNKKYHLFEVGGSDAHTKKEIGQGYTLIESVDKSFESIKKALLAKKSKSMGKVSSPFVHVKTVLNKIKKGLYF